MRLKKGGWIYWWSDWLGEIRWVSSSDWPRANLCPVVGKTALIGGLATGIIVGLGLLIRYWIRLGWRTFLEGLVIVMAVLLLVGLIMGICYWASCVRHGETAEVVRAWVAAKKGKYCPEVEFVEEEKS